MAAADTSLPAHPLAPPEGLRYIAWPMRIEVKICGLRTPAAVEAAASGGARMVGLVFYPPSPRCLDLAAARSLAELARGRGLAAVGVFVDADDDLLAAAAPALDWLQLHGHETPGRVATLRARFDLPVIKAIPVTGAADLAAAERWRGVADRLLFDARPPAGSALPGGNGTAFDWSLLAGFDPGLPWILSGGLDAACLAEAVAASGARALDVSSGVESAPGEKSLEKIHAFLDRARAIARKEHLA